MKNNTHIGNLGEIKLIKLIEELVFKKTGKKLLRDDSFFFDIKDKKSDNILILNLHNIISD